MNGLFWVLSGATLVPAAAAAASVRGKGRAVTLGSVFAATVVIAAAAAGYGVTGRYGDWMSRTTDEATDWQLAARLTEARRAAKAEDADAAAMLQLAQANYDAGRYADAVKAVEEAERRFGRSVESAVLKAEALYYREGRVLSREVKALLDEALAANPYHVPARLLLANDAYLHERWDEAIGEWEFLLRSGAVRGRERGIENALQKARIRQAQSSKTNQ